MNSKLFELMPSHNRTWAEINLMHAKQNYETIRKHINNEVKICCVVKANAYGHGAVRMAQLYQNLGADFLAVSNIEESLELRAAGITIPILNLGYCNPKQANILSKENVSQCVFSEEYGKSLSEEAIRNNCNVKIHIKLDTGMGRIGFQCRGNRLEYSDILKTTCLPNLIPEGIFTHFASADEGENGKDFTLSQLDNFHNALSFLERKGCKFKIRHCANSAATLDYPESHLDMVRVGITLYGLLPSKMIMNKLLLHPVLSLKTIIHQIKNVEPNQSISYGREFFTTLHSRIATVPIGYADGLMRNSYKNGVGFYISNEFTPVVGKICMDQCMLDITHNTKAFLGSEVLVYGHDKCSVARIAEMNNTIPYEVLCAISSRVPRVYILEEAI